jgi:hypothetical protein
MRRSDLWVMSRAPGVSRRLTGTADSGPTSANASAPSHPVPLVPSRAGASWSQIWSHARRPPGPPPPASAIPSTWQRPTARSLVGSPRRTPHPTLRGSAHERPRGSPPGGRRDGTPPSRRPACPARALFRVKADALIRPVVGGAVPAGLRNGSCRPVRTGAGCGGAFLVPPPYRTA